MLQVAPAPGRQSARSKYIGLGFSILGLRDECILNQTYDRSR